MPPRRSDPNKTPKLIEPYDTYLLKQGTTFHDAIIAHLRLVLMKYLGQPGYSKFYVGITQDVDQRLAAHQAKKPEYKWMIPIYEEAGVPQMDRFDQMEQLAIKTFGKTPANPNGEFTHPNAPPGRKLVFDNRRENAPPQNLLYLLVG